MPAEYVFAIQVSGPTKNLTGEGKDQYFHTVATVY